MTNLLASFTFLAARRTCGIFTWLHFRTSLLDVTKSYILNLIIECKRLVSPLTGFKDGWHRSPSKSQAKTSKSPPGGGLRNVWKKSTPSMIWYRTWTKLRTPGRNFLNDVVLGYSYRADWGEMSRRAAEPSLPFDGWVCQQDFGTMALSLSH